VAAALAVPVLMVMTVPEEDLVVLDSHLAFPDHLHNMQVEVAAPFRDPVVQSELELLVVVPVVLQAPGLRLMSILAAAVAVPQARRWRGAQAGAVL
jgi:hypothetical protein